MYNLKPILQNVEIDLPNCMYSMKPINARQGEVMEAKNNSNSEDEKLLELEARQKVIIQQLEVLKQTLLSMRCPESKPAAVQSKTTTQPKATQKEKIQPIDTSLLSDIVINANPDNIPYGILALKNLWKDRLQIVADTFVHSTIANYPENAVKFSELISKRDETSKLPVLKVTIIWKDTDVTSMVSSSTKYVPIYGEINIMRYLNRVGPKEFNYDKTTNAFQATVDDSVLDMCYVLSKKETTHKDRQFHLQQLNQRLGKQKYFNDNDEWSFVDLAVSSVLKQVSTKNAKDLPGNLPGFLARVAVKAGF